MAVVRTPKDLKAVVRARRRELGYMQQQLADRAAPDAHAKNYSLLLSGTRIAFAPLLDRVTQAKQSLA